MQVEKSCTCTTLSSSSSFVKQKTLLLFGVIILNKKVFRMGSDLLLNCVSGGSEVGKHWRVI